METSSFNQCAFYYYGMEHASINLYHFVKKHQNLGNLYLFSLDSDYTQQLQGLLAANPEVAANCYHFTSIKELSLTPKATASDYPKLKGLLTQVMQDIIDQGYQQIYWIHQVALPSREKFDRALLEQTIQEIFGKIQFSLLSIYDMGLLFQQSPQAALDTLEDSYQDNTHILYKMNLIETAEYLKGSF